MMVQADTHANQPFMPTDIDFCPTSLKIGTITACLAQIKLNHDNYHLALWRIKIIMCIFARRKPIRIK